MNETTKNKKAMYIEFVNGQFTVQILVTPEGEYNGKPVPLVVYRRRVSEDSPKSQWRTYPSTTVFNGTDKAATTVAALNVGKLRVSHMTSLMSQLESRGYKLLSQPFIVDFTQSDFVDTCALRTPYKVLNRVLKCRTYLGFPELPKAK